MPNKLTTIAELDLQMLLLPVIPKEYDRFLLILPSPALGQVWVDAQLQYHTSESENIQVFLLKTVHKYVPRQSNPKLQANKIIQEKN